MNVQQHSLLLLGNHIGSEGYATYSSARVTAEHTSSEKSLYAR